MLVAVISLSLASVACVIFAFLTKYRPLLLVSLMFVLMTIAVMVKIRKDEFRASLHHSVTLKI